MLRRGTEQRDDDEGELEVIEKEGQHKNAGVDEQQEADLSARQRGEQTFDPDVTADAVEGQRKTPRADHDEDGDGGQFRRGFCGGSNQVSRQTATEPTEN